MKFRTKYLFFLLSLLVIGSCTHEHLPPDCSEIINGWNISSMVYPDNKYQSDICFPVREVGYMVGSYGSISKTEDSGESWKVIHSGELGNKVTTNNLTAVSFIDQNIGFIGGQNNSSNVKDYDKGAILLKTIDGGKKWSIKYFIDIYEFLDIKFTSTNDGLALVSILDKGHWETILMSTNDGGTKWNKLTLPFKELKSRRFIELSTYIALKCKDESNKEILYRTNNSGKSWETKALPVGERALYFIDDNVGYCSNQFYYEEGEKYQTLDGGNTWHLSSFPLCETSLVHFKNINEGFIITPIFGWGEPAGGELNEEVKAYMVSQTSDGGLHWENVRHDKACNFYGSIISRGGDVLYSCSSGYENPEGVIYRFEHK